MEAAAQWREEDGRESSHTLLESSSELRLSRQTDNEIKCDVYPETTSSMFGSVECGEPMTSQYLILDFPLKDDPDSEEAQQKVREFWEFLDKHPELDKFVSVEDEQEPTLETTSSVTPDLPCSDDDTLDQQTTALSTLCLYETSGTVDRAFHSKMQNTACDLEPPSYFDRTTAPLQNICLPDATTSSTSVDIRATPSSDKLSELNETMRIWDERHSKSMEPPGHPPSLIHSELARRVQKDVYDYKDTIRNNDPYNY